MLSFEFYNSQVVDHIKKSIQGLGEACKTFFEDAATFAETKNINDKNKLKQSTGNVKEKVTSKSVYNKYKTKTS